MPDSAARPFLKWRLNGLIEILKLLVLDERNGDVLDAQFVGAMTIAADTATIGSFRAYLSSIFQPHPWPQGAVWIGEREVFKCMGCEAGDFGRACDCMRTDRSLADIRSL